MNKILIILNPAARGKRAKDLQRKIEILSPRAVVHLTSGPGDAEIMARRGVQQGYAAVVAAGGDGTVNEVVNGVGESPVALGILPVGTMNVFAMELGIPLNNLRRAWRVIEAGECREVDLPKANGCYFVQLAGVGLDAEVVRRTSSDSKKVLGPMSYLISLVQIVARESPLLRIDSGNGVVREGRFILVGNGRFYGGPFALFRQAALDDGLLDVLVFKNQSYWDVIRYMQAILFGNHADLHDVEYFQSKKLTVSSRGEDIPVELDGEVCGTLPYQFGFAQRKLKVLAPKAEKRVGYK